MSDNPVQIEPQIILKLTLSMTAFDWQAGSLTTVMAGKHPVERIPNPFGNNTPWLIILGTDIGASEAYWKNYPTTVSISEETP